MLLKLTVYISVVCGSEMSFNAYNRTLHQPYLVHVKSKSSEIITSISQKVSDVIHSVLWTSMNLISSIIIMLVVLLIVIM